MIMTIDASSLSILCQSVETFVRDGLDASANDIEVTVGAPAVAAAATPKMNRVNLFFNRFEPAGYGAGGHPQEPWLLRLHCFITAFGQDDAAENITAGEFELRMIGEVIRLFHETPVMAAVDVSGEGVRLQAVFTPLDYENLNHLWSTQNDASYRPSVAYEFALGPIVPSVKKSVPKLAGGVSAVIRSSTEKSWDMAEAISISFPARPRSVDISLVHWIPAVCFVTDGCCTESLFLDLDAIDLVNDTLAVWLAGDPAGTIAFKWLIWDSVNGWVEMDPGASAAPVSTIIDPEGSVPEALTELAMPLTAPFAGNDAQAQLIAERSYTDPLLSVEKTVKSNPILVTFYRGNAS